MLKVVLFRSTLGVAVLNDFIYAVGGFDGSAGLNTAEVGHCQTGAFIFPKMIFSPPPLSKMIFFPLVGTVMVGGKYIFFHPLCQILS